MMVPPTPTPYLVIAHPEVLFAVLKAGLDGMISHDQFCGTRWGVLQRSWWRRPNRLRREAHGRGIRLRLERTRRRRTP
jgi:hypothetical protein